MSDETGTHDRETHGAGAGFAVLLLPPAPREIPSATPAEIARAQAMTNLTSAVDEVHRAERWLRRKRIERDILAAAAREAGCSPPDIGRAMGVKLRRAHEIIDRGLHLPWHEDTDQGGDQ